MPRLIRIFLLFALSFGLLVTIGQGNDPSSRPHKQWSLSLAGNDEWYQAKKTIDVNSYREPRVEFTDDNTVVVTFMHSVNKPEPSRESSALETVSLEAMFFDVRDGHLRGTMQWVARRDAGELRPVREGGFLVHAGDKIMLYSADLKLMRERDLEPAAVAPNGVFIKEWKMDVAPGGRLGHLRFRNGREVTHFWIRADSLKDDFTVTIEGGWSGIVAEDAIAARQSAKRPSPTEVLLWERGKDWRQIATGYTVGTFLSEGELLIYAEKEFEVIDRQGNVLFRGSLSWADPSQLPVRRNLDGTRFAINESHHAVPILQKHDFFDWNFEVLVGDVNTRQVVTQISLGTQDSRQVDIALSPNGAHLATLTGSILSLYNLPEASH